MPYIVLCVTDDVVAQVAHGGNAHRQLAIRGASPELAAQIAPATGNNIVLVALNGAFTLSFGDGANAIWAVHQEDDMQAGDFNDLYNLLVRRQDINVTFRW